LSISIFARADNPDRGGAGCGVVRSYCDPFRWAINIGKFPVQIRSRLSIGPFSRFGCGVAPQKDTLALARLTGLDIRLEFPGAGIDQLPRGAACCLVELCRFRLFADLLAGRRLAIAQRALLPSRWSRSCFGSQPFVCSQTIRCT
jgi:hypothetical protein